MRKSEVSYIDVSGVIELSWPRLQISSRRFGQPVIRQRAPIALQKGHARVVQERLIEDQFKDVDSAGPVMYADFMQAEPGHLERRHAQGTLAAFGRALLDRHDIQISQERR